MKMGLTYMRTHGVLIFTLLFITNNACAEWFKAERAIMGTQVVVEVWHEEAQLAKQCSQQVFDEMRRIDTLMSPYKEDSELSKINRLAARQPVNISAELYELIEQSLVFSKLSDGAFDITFASVGGLYDYRNRRKPGADEIQQKLPAINYRYIQLNDKTRSIAFAMQGVRIDLGGIAKGYAVDNGIAILRRCGIKNGLVSAGGDSRILGDRNGWPWVLGVKHPRQKDKVVVKLPLSNVAISTSGDYERFFIEDGKRYHHIIRPQTGQSVDETWSATVIGDKAMMTDALSTTLFVLDVKQALKLVAKLKGVDAIIIDAHGKMHYSQGLMPPANQE